MVKYRVNIDYEYQLFDRDYHADHPIYRKINEELEYLFLWLGKEGDQLSTKKEYSRDYLNYIKEVRGDIPSIVKEDFPAIDWWGNIEEITEKRKLNSKLTSTKLAIENNWAHPETAIISNIKDFNISLSRSSYKKWILKDPFQFSGKGIVFFDEGILKKKEFLDGLQLRLSKHPLIFDPLLERKQDFGTTFFGEKLEKYFIVENYNDFRGSFKGGFYDDAFDNVICSSLEKIKDEYFRLGAKDSLQVDSFTYFENGAVKKYTLVEVNYRKTMGLVLYLLVQKFNYKKGELYLIRRDKLNRDLTLDKVLNLTKTILCDKKMEIIILSPLKNRFFSFLILGDDREMIEEVRQNLIDLISRQDG